MERSRRADVPCEILEKFDDELSPIEVNDRLKDRKLHWASLLAARKL
jgi:hypothetical protein